MNIFTDSKVYTERILNIKPGWEKCRLSGLHDIPSTLSRKLFQSAPLYATEMDSDPLWEYAFIVDHAPQSQFSILMDVLRNNNDFKDGILCLAGSGQNFRGYRNRKWVSLAGNIHISAFLNPNCPVDHFHTGFTILSAVSVVQTIDAIEGLKGKASIKWVNDILINEAKVSGVLTQTQTQGKNVTGVFLGIGLNVERTPKLEQDRFVPIATSLSEHTTCSQGEVLKSLLKNISANYKTLINGGYSQILNIYRDRSIILGKEITVYSDPLDGPHQITAKGKVVKIGENLELYLEDQSDPVTKGRITF